MRWFSLLVCSVMLWPTPGSAMEQGLLMRYLVDRDGDGVLETRVCGDEDISTADDPYVDHYQDGFALRYPQGTTPCDDIVPGDRWGVRFEGFVQFDQNGRGRSIFESDIVADVNDGVRMAVVDPDTGASVCEFDFWSDVPEYDNYHSTDANGIRDVCSTALLTDKRYEVTIEFYHESDPAVNHFLFNRAYLNFWFQGVRGANAQARFFHTLPMPHFLIGRFNMRDRERFGVTQVQIRADLFTMDEVDLDAYREVVLECLAP